MRVTSSEFLLLELFQMNMIKAVGTEYIDMVDEFDVELTEIQEAILELYRNKEIVFLPPESTVDLELLSTEN